MTVMTVVRRSTAMRGIGGCRAHRAAPRWRWRGACVVAVLASGGLVWASPASAYGNDRWVYRGCGAANYIESTIGGAGTTAGPQGGCTDGYMYARVTYVGGGTSPWGSGRTYGGYWPGPPVASGQHKGCSSCSISYS